jgi:hypothetical protein
VISGACDAVGSRSGRRGRSSGEGGIRHAYLVA